MILQDTAIREEAGEREHLPFTLSHGIMIQWTSFSSEKIMERKNRELGTCFMHFGYPIFL